MAHFDNEHTAVGRPSASPVSDVSFVAQSWHALAMLAEALSLLFSSLPHVGAARTDNHTHTHQKITQVRETVDCFVLFTVCRRQGTLLPLSPI